MGLFFGLIKVAGLFRVNPKDEEEGLDHSYHGGSAYGDTAGESHFECVDDSNTHDHCVTPATPSHSQQHVRPTCVHKGTCLTSACKEAAEHTCMRLTVVDVSHSNCFCMRRYSKGDVAELRAEIEALKASMGGNRGPMGGGMGNGKPTAGHTEAVVV